MLNKINIWLQRRTFIKWSDKANLKTEHQLCETQNAHTANFDDLNQILGAHVNQHNDQLSENTESLNQLKRQGQRILANVFARFYYSNEARGIRKWK